MDFIDEKIDEYVVNHTTKESKLLYDLNRKTNMHVLQPRMLSGHFQGRVLSMISKMIQPKAILEIGTYTGYSALCLAEGLTADGELITIDKNYELEELVGSFFDKSPFKNQLKHLIGNAMDIIPELSQNFDLVFIDADKENYVNYYNLVFDKIRSGGYIIADNVLWSGKVVHEENTNDLDTQILREFNDMVQGDSRVENVLLPIRDGLMILRKK